MSNPLRLNFSFKKSCEQFNQILDISLKANIWIVLSKINQNNTFQCIFLKHQNIICDKARLIKNSDIWKKNILETFLTQKPQEQFKIG